MKRTEAVIRPKPDEMSPTVQVFGCRRDVRIESVKHRKADMHLVAPTDFDLRAQGLPLPIPYDLRKPRVGIAARA